MNLKQSTLSFPNIAFLASVIVLSVILFNWGNIPEGSKLILFLPAIFGVYIKFSRVRDYNSKFVSLYFLNSLFFIKYVVLPLLMVVNREFFVMPWVIEPLMTDAYLLMIYDLLWITIAINFFCGRIKKSESESGYINYTSSNKFFLIIILIGVLGLIYQPGFIDRLIFFSDDIKEYSGDFSMFDQGGLSALLFYFIQFIQVIIFIIVLKKIKKKGTRANFLKIFPLVLVSLANIAIVWSSNRATVVTTMIVTGYIVGLAFSNKKKLILGLFAATGVSIIFSMTLYRYFNDVSLEAVGSSKIENTFGIQALPYLIDVYLSGPTSVAVGIEATDFYNEQITFQTFVSDLFVSTNVIQPILTKSGVDVFKTTSSYLNTYTGKDMSLIIPLICQGRVYFGIFLAPILSIIAIFLMLKFEANSRRNPDIAMKYVWILIALRFAWMPGYSLPVLVRCFSKDFLPLFLVILLNNKFSKIKS